MIKKIEIERFSLTTSKPFDEVIAGVNAAIGQPDMAEFGRLTHEAPRWPRPHNHNYEQTRVPQEAPKGFAESPSPDGP